MQVIGGVVDRILSSSPDLHVDIPAVIVMLTKKLFLHPGYSENDDVNNARVERKTESAESHVGLYRAQACNCIGTPVGTALE